MPDRDQVPLALVRPFNDRPRQKVGWPAPALEPAALSLGPRRCVPGACRRARTEALGARYNQALSVRPAYASPFAQRRYPYRPGIRPLRAERQPRPRFRLYRGRALRGRAKRPLPKCLRAPAGKPARSVLPSAGDAICVFQEPDSLTADGARRLAAREGVPEQSARASALACPVPLASAVDGMRSAQEPVGLPHEALYAVASGTVRAAARRICPAGTP